MLIDIYSPDVIRFIDSRLALVSTHKDSPYRTIPQDQFSLYHWAKMYEELEPVVSDHIYDMFIRYLKRQQTMFPDIWEQVSLNCFKDSSWVYTGLFIEDHDTEDEEWLL